MSGFKPRGVFQCMLYTSSISWNPAASIFALKPSTPVIGLPDLLPDSRSNSKNLAEFPGHGPR